MAIYPRMKRWGVKATLEALSEPAVDPDVEVVGMGRAVTGLGEDPFGALEKGGVLGASEVEQGLPEVGRDEDPLDLRLGVVEEALDEGPVASDIEVSM